MSTAYRSTRSMGIEVIADVIAFTIIPLDFIVGDTTLIQLKVLLAILLVFADFPVGMLLFESF